ncbi:zinc finger and BTB domain-containing protein 17 isoform X2 [Drosophila kikkawai]|uniref:Zinc finger and BTB domain-containing protein 17 isoform X2 n=1 Tax=Drosophila kikkawai TaxID=30033 RepID=A0ABM4GI69_DROKI
MDALPSYPDLSTLCRLCLGEHQDAYEIFDEDEANLSIPVRLMACVSLDAKPADNLPKKVCGECRYQLEKSFLFRQRCQAAEKKLRKHVRLLCLGKRSRVFSKDPDGDDFDDDELEFEDSIAFIDQQDKLRQKADEKWRAEFKEEQEQELNKRLADSRIKLRAKLVPEVRKELAEEVRREVREQLEAEVRSDVREELRNEVSEEIRKEQLVKLLGELEVYLVEKKAGQWETLDGQEAIVKAPVNVSSSPAVKAPALQKIEAEQAEPEVEFLRSGTPETSTVDEVEVDTLELEDDVPTESEQDFRDIKMIGAGEMVRTEDGEIYIINANSTQATKPASSADFDEDNDITSYNIKEDGEIQFSGDKTQLEDVVVFNLDGEIAEEQQVYNFDENVIIVEKNDTLRDAEQPAKRKRQSEFVVKQALREGQVKPRRVTDTMKTFQCKICPVAFASEKLLLRHHNIHVKSIKNGKGGSLKCPDCGMQLSCASSLKRHRVIHSGIKPFKCDVCEASFSQREVLKRHMDTHTGAKRHKCPHCSTCFAQKSNLQQHISRVHMGNARTNKCHLCSRSFNHQSGLSRHLATHAGVMFTCKECDRQFNDRSALQRHFTNVHKGLKKSVDYGSEPEICEME